MKGYARRVQGVLVLALGLNVSVSLAKLVAGGYANSLAVIADGLHSGVDAIANLVALLVLRVASRPADADHPYGHQKYETMAAFVLSAMLILTAFELARSAFVRLFTPEPTDVTTLTFAVMLLTLAMNVGLAVFEQRAAKRNASDILAADAAQTRGDVFVSAGVLVGLGLQRLGVAWLDPVLAIAVAAVIAYSAWRVFKDVMPVLTDRILFEPEEVARVVMRVPGVVSVHDIRSRGPRRDAFVQMHLVVDADDVAGAHAITDAVEAALAAELGVREAFIHVEPEDDDSGPPGTRAPPGKSYQA